MTPPFRVEHVGSFIRPQKLPQAVRDHKNSRISDSGLKEVQDDALREVVAFQEAAAKYAPLDRLGIGPQRGFSSVRGGNQSLTPDDTRRKLERVMEVAREVWG